MRISAILTAACLLYALPSLTYTPLTMTNKSSKKIFLHAVDGQKTKTYPFAPNDSFSGFLGSPLASFLGGERYIVMFSLVEKDPVTGAEIAGKKKYPVPANTGKWILIDSNTPLGVKWEPEEGRRQIVVDNDLDY